MVDNKSKADLVLIQTLKFSYRLLGRTMANIISIRQTTRREKLLLLVFKIINLSGIVYYKLSPMFILVPEFFILKGLIDMLNEHRLGIKYAWISKLYNNRVKVIKVKNGTYMLNSFITTTEIMKHQEQLEHGLNRYIKSIQRNSKNLRLLNLETSLFKNESAEDSKAAKLKAIYPLSNVIENLVPRGQKIPYIRGVNEKGNIILGDLYADKNILIAGVPGAGKSVMEGVVIQSLMYFNDLSFILVDFKVVELCLYEHFQNVEFVEKIADFKEMLKKLNEEMEKRYQLMRGKYTHIDQYNKNNRYKQPYIVVVIDEVSEIRLNGNGDTKEIENDLLVLMNKGRAAGIYFICCTQNPKSDQFNPSIKNNCQLRFVGKIPDIPTQVLIGVRGTENFGTGYFKTNEGDTYYSCFVDPKKEHGVFDEIKNIREGEKKNYVNLNKIK